VAVRLAELPRTVRQSPDRAGPPAGGDASPMTNGSTKSEDRAPAAGAPRRDLVVALVLLGLGLGVIGLSLGVPAGVQTDPLGPRAFPLALGAAIGVCGLLLAAATVLGDRWTTSAAMFVETADDDASEGGLESRWRLVGAVAATAAYLVAFERLGYLLATPLYVWGALCFVKAIRQAELGTDYSYRYLIFVSSVVIVVPFLLHVRL